MKTGSIAAIRVFASFLLLAGGLIAAGGAWLAVLGGSPYYLLGGVAVTLSGALVWARRSAGAWLYVLFLAATLAWALWESGFNGWTLAPRLIGPGLIGLIFALPFVTRGLIQKEGLRFAPGRVAGTLGGLLLLVVLVAALLPVGEAAAPAMSQRPLAANDSGQPDGQWQAYGRDNAGTRFSPLTQINRTNVASLKPAWSYRTGIVQKGTQSPLEATPILVGDTLYLCSQTNVVIALDPETGREKWRFDPKVDATGASLVTACRGVAFAHVANAPDCPDRIISATFDARLLALDARSGRPCRSFGQGGTVNLRDGMGQVDPGFYYVSSAPTIVRGRIVLGGWIADNVRLGEPSGVIRAFEVATGKFAWAWDLGRPGFHGQPGPGETYTLGTPNSWGPMSGDDSLGLVYVPTGNATPDHWGGSRTALSDQFSSSVVALDVETGERRWSFQTVHHDVWDYDVGSQPTLVDLRIAGKMVPALVQPTKTGQVYVLDRRNGRPVAPVAERRVVVDPAPGDRSSPTQPFSVGMPSFAGEKLQERDMWGATPFDQLWCRIRFRSMRYDGPFTPIGTKEALVYPGIGGGMNWGSVSVDPERGILFVNSMQVPSTVRLIPRATADEMAKKRGSIRFHDLSLPLPQGGTPFAVGVSTFVSPLGVPCNAPPYGLMSAVDLHTGRLLWQKPLGTTQDSGPFGMSLGLPITMGLPMMGGSIVTRGGIVFVAATQERSIRALDAATGRELWKGRLPTGGQATPMTYISPKSGRQFVVIVSGGSVLIQSPLMDRVEAFALPVSRSR
jgi:quinoprotein glucose dehydrogenase